MRLSVQGGSMTHHALARPTESKPTLPLRPSQKQDTGLTDFTAEVQRYALCCGGRRPATTFHTEALPICRALRRLR